MKLAFVALCGCSFALTRAPDPPYKTIPACTASSALPVLDIAGIFLATIVGAGFSIDHKYSDHDQGVDPGAVIAIGGGLVYLAAAIYGFHTTGVCSDARRDFVIAPVIPDTRGIERGLCRVAPEPACDAGLVCASNHCVVLPPR